jgi:WD40 domain-containing protein
LRRLERHTHAVHCLAISRDGRTLASGGADRTVFLWDFPEGTERRSFKRPGWVFSLSFSGDGRTIASGSLDQSVHVRNVGGHQGYVTFGGYEGPIRSVVFFRDGKMIAAGNDDGNVRLWEVASNLVRREFAGHKGIVHAVALSPDETRLVSGGEDGQILAWDVGAVAPAAAKTMPAAADLETAWRAMAGPPREAFHAMTQLKAEPAFLPFLDVRLEPLFKISQRLNELMRELESEKFAVRQKATQELEKLGEFAVPFLEQKLRGNLSLETARRIELVVMHVKPDESGRYSTYLQMWRAIEILELLATDAARSKLQRLVKEFPDARIRDEAQAALQRTRKIQR